MSSEQQYIELYEQARQVIFDHAPESMNAVRDEAFEDFCRQGFPSKKVERYKYTDIQKLFAPDYGVNLSRLQIPVDPYEAFRCDVPNLSTSLYFVVNDMFYKGGEELSNKELRNKELRSNFHPSLPEGVIVGSLRDYPELISKYYARLAKTSEDAVTALNTMLAQDGMLVYVPKNVKVDRAIQVINILKATPSNAQRQVADLMVNRRVLIILEEGAEIKMLFCDHAADDRHFLTTQVIEAYVGNNASLDLYCLEETHHKNVRVSNVYIDQGRDSRVNHNVITLHNGTTRNKLDLTFSGEGAECQCFGCVIADKQQHVDNNTLITHKVPHCTSNELYKYVLDDKAVGAFAGRVLVEHGAQKTVSQMTNQNLTATKEARMYTQPMLEIYADDVKCAHGSTVGQLNDAALFYMRQRGISLQEAKLLLQNAFINEVIDHMQLEPLRDRLHYLVEKRFRGELNKCDGCKLCK
ncbi:Fe-S cluster assembly protein SufD [Prevotella sp. ne3005]|uniref:Fe-S cluster assembly protein SufD n=1 Tax=Prevotella sp. ne3005 TaxID=1761887 RepID=UPI0008BFB2B3|nr:Fe-S cluster assembly protein SufD [Prevotella sp. ne3005]SEM85371.1 Fe-S cluster assembly protein SufD [Prevotella sp. ne3005]